MRVAAALLVFLAAGQAAPDGFPEKPKQLRDPEGRFEISVPKDWTSSQPSGNVILRAKSKRSHGGHQLLVSRELGQDDVDKQRDRYLKYDSGQYAGAEVAKINEPYYGYRLQAPSKDKVLVRAFLTDGDDGLVISLSSPLRTYKSWQKLTTAIVASAKLTGPQTAKEDKSKKRRIFDESGSASLVSAVRWRSIKPDKADKEILVLALKGKRSEPHVILYDRGGPTNPDLVLSGLIREWKTNYSGVSMTRLKGKPPRLLAKNRRVDWTDYVTTFAVGQQGYALVLSCGTGSFERYRSVADEMFETLAIRGGPFPVLSELPGDVHINVKKMAAVHALSADEKLAKEIGKSLGAYFRLWGRMGFKPDKKAPPIPVQIVSRDEFDKASNGLGETPVAYNYKRGVVVVVAPDDGKTKQSGWTGKLYAAMVDACLHRDTQSRVPVWLATGMGSCFDVAGRTGGKPSEPHPAYIQEIERLGEALSPIDRLFDYTYGSLARANEVTPAALAWAYTNLTLYGKTPLTRSYRAWKKALMKDRSATPKFDLGKYKTSSADLEEHAKKNWRKP